MMKTDQKKFYTIKITYEKNIDECVTYDYPILADKESLLVLVNTIRNIFFNINMDCISSPKSVYLYDEEGNQIQISDKTNDLFKFLDILDEYKTVPDDYEFDE